MPNPTAVLRLLPLAAFAVASLSVAACQPSAPQGSSTPPAAPTPPTAPAAAKASVSKGSFGTLADGTAVDLYTLTNAHGLEMRVTNYGGIIVSLKVPDKSGALGDIVLGYNRVDDYVKDTPYFGAIVGRYGNRIGGARFTLDGKAYKLTANDSVNTLHGGLKGFDKRLWTATPVERAGGAALQLSLTSKDGDEGYPGTLQMTVTYTLTDANALVVDYLAKTDKATPVNVTQHSYFNLAGEGVGTIDGHVMQIHADRYAPVAKGLIPTGELAAVEGTPLDFRTPTAIGARIASPHPQMVLGGGYDHNWVINWPAGMAADKLAPVLRVTEPTTGRTLEVESTEPGLQFYSGNFLDGHHVGKSNRPYVKRAAFCVETQHFPDSPNQPAFPSTIVRPGTDYQSQTVFRFGVEK
ncbi:MAG: aldose epimerase family protein [Vicinamibacteraceae bacterium]